MDRKVLRKANKILSLLFVAIMALFVGVQTEAISPVTVKAATKNPTISKTSLNILIGEKYDLNIRNKISKSTYKWESSDKKVAVVNSKGIVTAKSKGTAVITCTITTPDKVVFKGTCKVTVREPALKFWISNKISKMNVGQEYDLNRKLAPKSSNDKTTWTTSDASIAKPNSLGVFTALKEGTVTITGKTMSGKSDSVTITVIDKDGIVKNQEELDSLLGSGASKITIKTDEELKFKINGGIYKDQQLVVDAPNAEVVNYGEFKSIEIKQIKNNTWYEGAKGNQIIISAKDTRIIVASGAVVKIETKAEGAVLRIENNGTIEEFVIDTKAEIEITGESNELIPVIVNAPDVKLKTSVPVDLVSNEKQLNLELLEGAEKSKIKAASKDVLPVIKSNFDVKVVVGEAEEDVKETPVPTPVPSGGGGGGYTPIDPTPEGKIYSLGEGKTLDNITSVKVKYKGLEFNVDSDILTALKGFLNNQNDSVDKWLNTTNTTKTYSGQEVRVTGTKGSPTKTVEFTDGILKGNSYTATVDAGNNSVTLTNTKTNRTFTVKKLNENSIRITPEPSFELTFEAN